MFWTWTSSGKVSTKAHPPVLQHNAAVTSPRADAHCVYKLQTSAKPLFLKISTSQYQHCLHLAGSSRSSSKLMHREAITAVAFLPLQIILRDEEVEAGTIPPPAIDCVLIYTLKVSSLFLLEGVRVLTQTCLT